MKKTLLPFALLGCGATPAALAQTSPRPGPTAAELNKNFAIIEAGTEGESDAFDSLTYATPRRLVTYLKSHEVSAKDGEDIGANLYDATKDAAHLKLLGYSYSSGGTRGTIHKSVLQWQNAAGRHFAYALDEECEFTNIYKLASPGRSLYLLLGQEQGDMNSTTSEAFVVELKGNYLLLDKGVFGKNSPLVLSNVELSFDEPKQVLKVDLANHDASEGDDKVLAQWGYRGKFPARPFTMFRRTYPPIEPRRSTAAKTLRLKFSNSRFVRSQ